MYIFPLELKSFLKARTIDRIISDNPPKSIKYLKNSFNPVEQNKSSNITLKKNNGLINR